MPSSIVREPVATRALRHVPDAIAWHWITAILVVLLWTIGQTIDFAPKGALRVNYRSLHMLLGVTLGIVLIAGLPWGAQ